MPRFLSAQCDVCEVLPHKDAKELVHLPLHVVYKIVIVFLIVCVHASACFAMAPRLF